jgi:hypothetical protein
MKMICSTKVKLNSDNYSQKGTMMTRKLEEILNLPDSRAITAAAAAEAVILPKQKKPKSFRNISDFDKISAALPKVKGLGDVDTEFDELARRATEAYDDLMDLGMNVEARYSARVFEVASSMLKNAIDAKSAKIDKKLKMIELQLKKQKIDNDANPADRGIEIQGDGYIVSDRNSLLDRLKNMDKKE